MKNLDLPMLIVWVAGIGLCPCVLFFLAKMIGIL